MYFITCSLYFLYSLYLFRHNAIFRSTIVLQRPKVCGSVEIIILTLRLLKPEILASYIYGPTSGNAESRLFLFAAQCFNTESMQKVFLCHSCVKTFSELPRLP